ncbi:unnamed protein product [Boreogadus saida]
MTGCLGACRSQIIFATPVLTAATRYQRSVATASDVAVERQPNQLLVDQVCSPASGCLQFSNAVSCWLSYNIT